MAKESVIIGYKVDNDGALKKMRDMRGELDKTPESTQRASGGVTSFTKVLAGAAAAFYAVQGAARFMGGAIRESAEQDRILGQLAVATNNVGVAFNEVAGDLQGMFTKLQETTRFGDTDTAQVLTRLLNTTGDYSASVSLLTATLDTSVAMGKDANSVAEALGRAVQGNIGALSRYGITLDDATKKMLAQADATGRAEILAGLLNEKFGGAAQAELNNYSTQMAQLGNYYGDFKEAVGGVFTEFASNSGVIEGLIDVFKRLTEQVISFGKTLVMVANTDFDVLASATADAFEGAFKAKLMDLYITFSQLPGVVGDTFLQKAVELSKELEDLGGGIDRAMAKGTAAADEWEKKMRGLLVNGLNPAKKGVKDLGEEVDTFGQRLADLVDAGWTQWADYLEETIRLQEELKKGVQETSDALQDFISNEMDVVIIPEIDASTLNPDAEEAGEDIGQVMGEALTVAMLGEWDNLFNVLGRKWSEFLEGMVQDLIDGFSEAFKDGGEGTITAAFEGGWQGIKDRIAADPWGATLAGVGGAYNASQGSGGWGGALQGALGGGMAGLGIASALALSNPVTAIVAGILALAGGVAGFMGSGQVTPELEGSINLSAGIGSIDRTRDQDMSQDLRAAWVNDRLEEWREAYNGMFDIVRLFNSPELIQLLSEPGTWAFDDAGSVDAFAQLFREDIIPSFLRTTFRGAINQGLANFGVDADTAKELWAQLRIMGADAMIENLRKYVGAVVSLSGTIESMDWKTMMEEVGQDSMDTFRSMLSQTFEAIDMISLGMDQMDLFERADAAMQIDQLIQNVRQSEIQYLMQLQQMQDQMNRSVEQQIEGIIAGGLEGPDKANFYIDRIRAINADLADGVASPEELAALMADLQRYTSLLQGAMGDRFYSEGYDQIMIDALTWARDLSDDLYENFRLEFQQGNQDIVDELTRIYDLLTNWTGDSINDTGGVGHWVWVNGQWVWVGEGEPTTPPPDTGGGGGGGGPFTQELNLVSDVNVNSVVTVVPSELFTTYVQSVVQAEIQRIDRDQRGIN